MTFRKNFEVKLKRKLDIIEFFERVTIKKIFLVWLGLIIIFGALYFLTLGTDSSLIKVPSTEPLQKGWSGLGDAFYYSVVTATATGYGDLVPNKWSKILTILEIIMGLMIFGVLISKLVSFKQQSILQEVYEISFDERINKMRSSLYLFRSDLTKIIQKIEKKGTTNKLIEDMWILMNTCDSIVNDMRKLLIRNNTHTFLKQIDDLRLDLLLHSIVLSLKKIEEMLILLKENKYEFHLDRGFKSVKTIILNVEKIYDLLKERNLLPQTADKLNEIRKFVYEINKEDSISEPSSNLSNLNN